MCYFHPFFWVFFFLFFLGGFFAPRLGFAELCCITCRPIFLSWLESCHCFLFIKGWWRKSSQSFHSGHNFGIEWHCCKLLTYSSLRKIVRWIKKKNIYIYTNIHTRTCVYVCIFFWNTHHSTSTGVLIFHFLNVSLLSPHRSLVYLVWGFRMGLLCFLPTSSTSWPASLPSRQAAIFYRPEGLRWMRKYVSEHRILPFCTYRFFYKTVWCCLANFYEKKKNISSWPILWSLW